MIPNSVLSEVIQTPEGNFLPKLFNPSHSNLLLPLIMVIVLNDFMSRPDISKISNDSEKLCKNLLKKYGLVLTPGIDFDSKEGKKYVRFCYSYPEKEIIKGIKKLNSIFN